MKLSIEIPITYQVQDDELSSLKADLNMAITGMYKCNQRDANGKVVPHPDIDSETYEDLIAAHQALARGGSCIIIAEFDTNNCEWKVVDFK